MGLSLDFSIIKKPLFFVLLISVFYTKAQTITGTVFDMEDKTPISSVSVVLYEYNSNKIIDYTLTDEKGKFQFDVALKKNAYTLKFRHLSYLSKAQNIIIEQESNKSIVLTIALQKKVEILNEVVITASQPIIVKKDTIIYNIKHWAKANNQTLEEVLSKIEGFKILANGEIEVQGKRVNKVIVNNKEIFDVGASLFTKSLDPKNIKSIEVRFDEKKSKLKESLLDTEKYVVLDIKLKDDLKNSFFGKIRQTTGYQNKFRFGGYTNLFSLKDKTKLHLFGEIDDFGKQTISLKNIKHIGEEALQKIFELPADFKSLTEKEHYHEELYGFNNYNKNEKRIIGLSSKFEINDQLNLFFGSYNTLDNIGKSRFFKQQIINDSTRFFSEFNNLKEFSSKNKLELKYDTKKTKLVLNTNLTYNNSNFEQENTVLNHFYQFNLDNAHLKNYNNLKFENMINEKIGIEVKSSYSVIEEKPRNLFYHNNPFYSFELIDNNNNTVYNFEQNKKIKKQNLISSIMFQFRSKLGIIETGGIYLNRKFNFKSNAQNILTNDPLQEFNVSDITYKITNYKPFLKHRISISDISISNSIEYSVLNYPTITNTTENKQQLNYSLVAQYSNRGFYTSLKYNNRLSSFPLNKLIQGKSLLNFQTIELPATSITPQKEEVFEFAIHKNFKKSKTNLTFALLKGRSNTLDLYLNSTNSPFIFMKNNQLEGEYTAISTAISKKFKNGISITLEPEFLTDKSQNINSNTYFHTITDRYFLGMKIENNKKSKRFNYFLYPKYTLFEFSNTLNNFSSKQEMFSIFFNTNYELVKNKLFFDINARNVLFFGGEEGSFTNINLSFNGTIKRFYWRLSVKNILNDQKFIRQSITPIYFLTEENVVFGRFIKFSIEYKFY